LNWSLNACNKRRHPGFVEALWTDIHQLLKKRRLVMRRFKSFLGFAIIIMIFALSTSLAVAQTAAKADAGKTTGTAEKVNINKATVEQLMEIKGIGQSYAERIVEYREKNGPFEKIEDIMNVKGIGEKKFEAIKGLITI